jgi:AcrR family transcriptional regulator
MPQLLHSKNRADDVAWIIAQLLADEGAKAVTMRRISRYSRHSTSSLVHHWGSKERLLRVAMSRTVRWRLIDIENREFVEGIAAFVPRDDITSYGLIHESIVLARAWLGWRELWRTEPLLEEAGRQARGEERWMLGRAIGGTLSDEELDGAYALLEGLVVARCAPVDPMPRERAVALLVEHSELIRGRHPQAS